MVMALTLTTLLGNIFCINLEVQCCGGLDLTTRKTQLHGKALDCRFDPWGQTNTQGLKITKK